MGIPTSGRDVPSMQPLKVEELSPDLGLRTLQKESLFTNFSGLKKSQQAEGLEGINLAKSGAQAQNYLCKWDKSMKGAC